MTRLFVFAGGGTGGHLTPGFAVAEELLTREPAARVLFLGSDRALEQSMVTEAGFEHRATPAAQGRLARTQPLQFALRSWRTYRQARAVLRDAAAIVGLGGFASVFPVLAAARARVPIVLLEQNAIAGRSTRLLARWAATATVCSAYPGTAAQLPRPARVVYTGNPVRAALRAPRANSAGSNTIPDSNIVLILGGSQGAAGVNQAVLDMVREDPAGWRRWRLVHQTGREQRADIAAQYRELGIDATVAGFFSDLGPWYRSARLAIARAGATTLAELACAGCPAILVPYPLAADNHQTANAEFHAARGAAVLVPQTDRDDTCSRLSATCRELLDSPQRLAGLSRGMRDLSAPDAAARVVDELLARVRP